MEAAFEKAQDEFEERIRDRFEEDRGFDEPEPEHDTDDWFYSDEDACNDCLHDRPEDYPY